MIANLTEAQLNEVHEAYLSYVRRGREMMEEGKISPETFASLGENPEAVTRDELIEKIADGVYSYHDHYHFGHEFSWVISKDTFYNEFRDTLNARFKALDRGEELEPWDAPNLSVDYGTCDSVEQIFEAYPELITDPRHFIARVIEVKKSSQPAKDGWRWHKHGPYIGNKSQGYEYLYDEPDVESVIMFEIIQVKPA